MNTESNEIRDRIRSQLDIHLPKDMSIENLEDDAPLVTAGLLDSVAALKLVDYLEATYEIEFDPEELSADYLDTVTLIVKLVQAKLEAA